jgi:hypothetical protein
MCHRPQFANYHGVFKAVPAAVTGCTKVQITYLHCTDVPSCAAVNPEGTVFKLTPSADGNLYISMPNGKYWCACRAHCTSEQR